MPNSKVSINVDLNNIDASIQNNAYYSRGSKGVNLLEQAYEKNEVYLQSQKMIEFLTKKINEPNSNIDLEKAMVILDDLTQNPANPHYVLNINSIEQNTNFTLDDIIHINDAKNHSAGRGLANPQDLKTADLFYGVFEGNAGYAAKVFNFGTNPIPTGGNGYVKMVLSHPQTGQHLITDSFLQTCQNRLMTASTEKKGPQFETLLNADYGILSSHSYACSLQNRNGTPFMKVINPHNSSSPLLLSLEQFRKFFYSVTINNIQ